MVRKKMKRKQLNNAGSTIIVVLVMLSFMLILATVVTSATSLNLRMKRNEKQSTKTFYTSEDAVNEIYVSLGNISTECFAMAYQDEIASVVGSTDAGSYTVDNIECNKNLRLNYIHRVLNKLNVIDEQFLEENKHKYTGFLSNAEVGVFARNEGSLECKNIVAVLGSYIEDDHLDKDGNPTLKVKSIGSFSISSAVSTADDSLFAYVIRLHDCVVEYITESGYYSYITFDCQMGMPDRLVNITDSEVLKLDSFVQYALIGNEGIEISADDSLTLNGNAFGGPLKGILVNPGAALNVNGGNSLSTSGDINVKDGSFTTNSNVNLWCYNFKTSNDTANKGNPAINLSGGTTTFVRDDLQLDGDNSNVNIAGEFYGYGFEKDNSTAVHRYSSSIIMNGNNSRLDLTNLNKLVVAGRAYVDFESMAGNAAPLATGQAVSLIGDQEIYLVPPAFMGGSNPVEKGQVVNVNITEDNFFGYKYLNAADGLYTIKTIDNKDYYYFKFANEGDAADYVKAIFDDETYEAVLAEKGIAYKESYDSTRNYMKSMVTLNAQNINSLITTGNGTIQTKSTMIAAAPGNGFNGLSYVASTSNDYNFGYEFEDLSNRYTVLSKTLYQLTTTSHVTSSMVNMMYPNLAAYSTNVYENIISLEGFKAYTENHKGPRIDKLKGSYDGYILCAFDNSYSASDPLIISNDTVTLPSAGNAQYSFKDYSGGVVVASGDVIVKKNFNGTIIAGGTIIVEDNVTVGGLSNIADLVKSNQKYAEIFKVWSPLPDSDDSGFLDVQNMTYKDMVILSNWRKYDDSNQNAESPTE